MFLRYSARDEGGGPKPAMVLRRIDAGIWMTDPDQILTGPFGVEKVTDTTPG